MGASHTFSKAERLSDRKLIEAIFNKQGKSIHKNPLLFVYLETILSSPFPAQVMVSVSKKRMKRAHDRNRIKRLLREAYRLNKHRIYESIENKGKQYALALLYLDNSLCDYQIIEKQLTLAIDEFIKRTA